MKKREYSNSVSTLSESAAWPKGSVFFKHKKTGPSGPVKNEEESIQIQ